RQEIIVPGSRLKASTQPEWRRARLDMFARPLRRVTVGSMPLPLSEMLTCTTRSTPSENTLTEIATAQIGRAHVELQSRFDLVCRLLLEKKKTTDNTLSRRNPVTAT